MSWFFEVRHEDDLLTVIDRILTSADDDVIVAIPEGSRILSSEENFMLLKREAEAAGKRVTVQTTDPRGRLLASRAGLPVLRGESAASSMQRRFSDILPPGRSRIAPSPSLPTSPPSSPPPGRTMSAGTNERAPQAGAAAVAPGAAELSGTPTPAAALPHEHLPTYEPLEIPEAPAAEQPLASARSHLRMPRMPFVKLGIEAGVVVAGVAVAFLVANEVLPKVEVRIRPRTEAIALTVPETVSVAGEDGTIRGQKLTVEEAIERSVPASGTAEVSTKASGTITIYNAYSSAPQTLVATTRFVSQDGLLFRLDETTVVPGAVVENGNITPSSISVRVTADAPGPEYNIGPSSFSIPGFQGTPKYTAFTARSTEPMRGGAKGTVKIVTADDIAKAQEGLAEALAAKLREKFAAQLPAGLEVLEGAVLEEISVGTDVKEGTPADAVVAKAEGRRTAIAYVGEELRGAILEMLSGRIPEETTVVTERMHIRPSVRDRNLDKGTLRLDVAVEAEAAWRIDVDGVREAIAGKREGEIRGWLAEQEAIANAQVRFTPFWRSSAPTKRERIIVIVELDGKK